MSAAEVAAPTGRGLDRRDVFIAVLVGGVALAARLATVYTRGTLTEAAGYDQSVYYASADALIHGLVPYRDYTLLHPPGLSLLLAPVAFIGRLTSDTTGFKIAALVSMLAGAANAVLVTRIVRRLELSRTAAAVAGLLYAVTVLTVRSELSGRLEVWGNLFLLLGLYWYVSSGRSASARASILSGVALAAATSIKIVYAVPLAVVLLWHLVDRRRRGQLVRWIGGAIAGAVLIDGPFLVLAGHRMISMVVVAQARRAADTAPGPFKRAADLALATAVLPRGSHVTWAAITAAGAVFCAAIVVLAVSVPAGRLPSVLLLAQLAELLLAPTFYPFYGDSAAPALCLSAGAAVHALQSRRRLTARTGTALAAALVAVAAVPLIRVELTKTPAELLAAAQGETLAPPGSAMVRAAATARCVQATSPLPLILLDALSRDLNHRCPQWVDVSGRTYSVDRGPSPVPRLKNRLWQRDILSYLLAGQQYVLVDTAREGLDPHTMRTLGKGPVVARSRSFVLQRTVAGQAASGLAQTRNARRRRGRPE